MIISTRIRQLAIPVITAAVMVSSNAIADSLPKVAINGITKGALSFSGPVTISGSALDSDGISEIYGTIQNQANQLFFTPNGTFVKDPTRLPFTFDKNATQTGWATNAYAIPAGKYLYRMRAEDSKKTRSKIVTIPVTVVASGARVATAATAAPAARPAAQAPAAPAAAPAATAVAASAKAANGMNYCGGSGADADGDGFGWENKASCIIAGSKADKNPNCASSASDPDGDGWGWENEASCLIVTHCTAAAPDPDGDGYGWENNSSCVVVKPTGKFPSCTNAASDPDGDGYGWENNKTCVII